MENPKRVVKNEPRKSLFVLFAAGIFTIVVGLIVVIGLGSGDSEMAEGAGWIMIVIGVLCLGFYVFGRKTGKR